MKHKIYKIKAFKLIKPFTLLLSFDDATEQIIDFSPVLYGQLFGPLRDENEFAKVTIDPEVQTVVWPNGADFDPATLHDWPIHADALAKRAEQWKALSLEKQQAKNQN